MSGEGIIQGMNQVANTMGKYSVQGGKAIVHGGKIAGQQMQTVAYAVSNFVLTLIKLAGEYGAKAITVASAWSKQGYIVAKHWSVIFYHEASAKAVIGYKIAAQFLITYQSQVLTGIGSVVAFIILQKAWSYIQTPAENN